MKVNMKWSAAQQMWVGKAEAKGAASEKGLLAWLSSTLRPIQADATRRMAPQPARVWQSARPR